MGAFQLLARANKVVLRLFHLGVNLTALIQRQGEAQAHLVLAHIAVVILGRIGFRATVGGVRNAGRGAQAQGWQMAVLRLTNLLAGQVLAQTRLQQTQVAVFRLFQQGVNGLRFIRFEAVHVQRRQLRIVIPGDLTQGFQRVVEVVTRGHFVSQHGIVL